MNFLKTDFTSHDQERARASAFQYLVSIFEAASPMLTYKDIFRASFGVGGNKNNLKKKKHGTRSSSKKISRSQQPSKQKQSLMTSFIASEYSVGDVLGEN